MYKKILLVSPASRVATMADVHPPLNLGYIAAYLEKHNIEVRIVDEHVGHDIKKEIKAFMPDIVGVTATTPLALEAYRIAGIARDAGCITVMGGRHASILPSEALEHVDMVVVGEGEKAMMKIVNGSVDKIVKSDYVKDLDELPPPAWHLMNMEHYLTVRKKDRYSRTHLYFIPPDMRVGAHVTMRGCPYSCVFCYNSWKDAPLRFHSAQRVISDLIYLVEKYKVQAMFFMDDDMFAHKKRLKEICRLMKENKINIIWGCQAKVDSINLELLEIAKEAGCRQVGFGFESGSQRILNILKKGRTTVEQNAEAIRLCKKAGILSFASFMVGNPTEEIDDLEATYRFVKEHDIDMVGAMITTPYPGTELWDWCKKNNLIPEKVDWSMYTTAEESVSACNTIAASTIRKYKDNIEFCKRPLTIQEILGKIWESPLLLLALFKNPRNALSYLLNTKFIRNMTFRH